MPPQSIGSPPYVPLQQDAMHYLARVLQAVADAQHAQKMVDAGLYSVMAVAMNAMTGD